jgi:ABC-type cobalamin transport system permease subunit
MQTILNNPLASPYTLGVSAAAAFGASLAIVLDIAIPGVSQTWIVPANAFVFALLSALLLDGVARWRGMSTAGVVLMGIALVFAFHALVSLMQFIASADALQGLVFWTLGSLARADWTKIGVLTAALALALPLSMRNAWTDEPLSALDLNHQFHVMQVLRDVTRERDIVTVVVLHDINAAMRACGARCCCTTDASCISVRRKKSSRRRVSHAFSASWRELSSARADTIKC